ncbi:MerR family transcriptional regulator [Litorihabitans aurantiacus]|uniref:Transcriptional regulator, MerR family protein n=1 Tax=Litorihabitans aurantiacus TaxID=1930061 RepID=A0AA38CU32_9MICO|nr:MerR family transcriptional regulator [Litorihabitans aurantiacus]GMA33131.1 transcriptional regulator, MerR family protein [Litorihabitans aurantiacus]
MAWSTQRLADLAGTTVKTVRYYHRVGVLDEPERTPNGYKQYGPAHLVQLLRVRLLADLGVPLAEVRDLDDGAHPESLLRRLRAELDTRLATLERLREEVTAMLEHGAPADLPLGFSAAAHHLSPTDRALIRVYARVYDDVGMADLRRLAALPATPLDDEFVALPADADDAARADLAARYAPEVRALLEAHPGVDARHAHLVVPRGRADATIAPVLLDLFNPAQIDVLVRIAAINGVGGGVSDGGGADSGV